MRTSEARRYSRLAAIAALAISLIAGSFYARRAWQAKLAERNAPPHMPSSIEKSSQTFSYAHQDGERTIFTVRASHATQFKGGNHLVLLDVWITIYGATGARADNIHTHACDYDQDAGKFSCAGDVQLDFQSAGDAQRGASSPGAPNVVSRIVHAQTRGVSFDRDSGDAWTDQPVTLTFPGGSGTATGVNYHSKDGVINLLHDVRFRLQSAMPGLAASHTPNKNSTDAPNSAPLDVSASTLEFKRDAGILLMQGPVVAMQSPPGSHRELHSSDLTIELDTEMRARRITARGNATAGSELRSTTANGDVDILADAFAADFAAAGWMQHFRAEGHVHSTTKSSTGHDEISASRVEAEMAPQLNVPANARAEGGVKIDSDHAGTTWHFESAQLDAKFENAAPAHPGDKPVNHLSHAETQSAAILSWLQPVKAAAPSTATSNQSARAATTSSSAPDKMLLTGQHFQMAFGDQSRLNDLQVHGAAKLDRTDAAGAGQISTSDDLAVHLDNSGDWSELVQDGHVRLHDSLHSAQGDHAHIDHASNVLKLTGAAQVADADSRTNADTLELSQTAGDIHADGHVITTYLGSAISMPSSTTPALAKRASAPRPQSASASIPFANSQSGQPTHASAEHLAANSQSGKATYTGHARLWQADSSIEGDTVILDRNTREIDAQGNVHAAFLQQPSASTSSAKSHNTQADIPAIAPVSSNSAAAKTSGVSTKPRTAAYPAQPQLWKIRAAHMTYSDPDSRAHLDGGFTAASQEFSIAGQTGDLYFTLAPPPAATASSPSQASSPAPTSAPRPAQSLDHATAIGKVAIRQGDRHGTADRGEYTAADGKFTLSGGNPIFYDASGNSTTGRQLTFFLSDDTVLVQSENASLPQLRHRVEK